MNGTEWAYLAGIIDGEGYVSLMGNTIPVIQVTTTSSELLDWIKARVPGPIRPMRESMLPNGKPNGRWQVNRKEDVRYVLEGVMPFLVLKKRQAEVVLQFIEKCMSGGGVRRTVGQVELLEEFESELKMLNHKGLR